MPDQATVTLPPRRRDGQLFRALRSVKVDPDLAHDAAEEVADAAGDNMAALITKHVDARIAEIREQASQTGAQVSERRAELMGELKGEIAEGGAAIAEGREQFAALMEEIKVTKRRPKVLITLVAALDAALFMLLGLSGFQGRQLAPMAAQPVAVEPAGNPAPAPAEPASDPESSAPPAGRSPSR